MTEVGLSQPSSAGQPHGRYSAALTVLVSVGGWSWSGDFSEMALTRQSRAVFIASVMEFLEDDNSDVRF